MIAKVIAVRLRHSAKTWSAGWADEGPNSVNSPSRPIIKREVAVILAGEHTHQAGIVTSASDYPECKVCTVDIPNAAWRKSSWSGYHGSCVEVAQLAGGVGVRDTKDHGKGPVLVFSAADWNAFVKSLRGIHVPSSP